MGIWCEVWGKMQDGKELTTLPHNTVALITLPIHQGVLGCTSLVWTRLEFYFLSLTDNSRVELISDKLHKEPYSRQEICNLLEITV